MKIRTQFVLTMSFFSVLLAVTAGSLFITNRQIVWLTGQEEIARTLEREANELSYLSGAYLLYRESQQLVRWESRFASFSSHVASLEPGTQQQIAAVSSIRANLERLRSVFNDVRTTLDSSPRGQGNPVDPSFVQVSWSRMEVQNQGMIFDAARLAEMLDTEIEQLQQANVLLVLVLIAIFGALLLASYVLTYRRTLNAVSDLQAGAKIIGSGRLDHTLEVKRNDEIGDLSRAFNRMTASLKEVTASKADLESEVAERIRAEEETRRQKTVQEGINQILQAYLTYDTEEKLGRLCLKVVEELTQSKFGFIDEIGDDGLLHDIALSDPGWEACAMGDKTGHRSPPRDFLIHGLYGRVVSDGKSLLTNDPYSHPHGIGTPAGHPPLTAFLGVPLMHGGNIIGMVGLANRDGGYRAEDLQTAEALAPAIVEALMRKRAEDEITHLASFPELNPNPVVEVDADGNVTYANPVARELFPDLPDRGSRHPFLAGWESLANSLRNGSQPVVTRDVGIGGSWYIQTVFTVPSSQNFRVYGRDITVRKKAEEALEERTRELEAANRELETFSYSVSHDLQAPLRSMDGFSRLILQDYADKLDDQGKEYLNYIVSSSRQMSQLIRELLNLSRIARVEPVFQRVNLSELAQEVAAGLGAAQPERRVDMVVQAGLEAYGDRNLLKVVFENLLSNAFKFTAKSPSPKIEFGVTVCAGQEAFFVRDNGAGFDMQYVDKLFKPFQRLHRTADFPGTGVGLASVQRIVSRMGGRVWAEGELDKGATFYFTLRRTR